MASQHRVTMTRNVIFKYSRKYKKKKTRQNKEPKMAWESIVGLPLHLAMGLKKDNVLPLLCGIANTDITTN